jgi:thioredoxin reductase (NADPH)
MLYDVIILGSGPAGLTAAIYAGRARLSTLVLSGNDMGGQVARTDHVENYPGFPEGISGGELSQLMQQQAERFGAQMEVDAATAVDLSTRPFRITTYGSEHEARTLIVATGASARKLGVPGEEELVGRGVSYCATCDGFFYRDKKVAVVGGGNSALEEAIFLTRFAERVYVVHRRDQLRADAIVQERAKANERVELVLGHTVDRILGEQNVTGVELCHCDDESNRHTLSVDGVFVYIGMVPSTQILEGQLELNEWGYIIADGAQHTSVDGVFAAGDVQELYLPQVATAVGSGARAAMEADKYLAEEEERACPARWR